jgi:hypothetical protein
VLEFPATEKKLNIKGVPVYSAAMKGGQAGIFLAIYIRES